MLKINVVLDVNVFISSIISFTGSSHKIIELALENKIKVFVSLDILKELEEKLIEEFEQPKEKIERQLALILSYAEVIEPKEKINVIKDDPDDNKFIECASEVNADFIVSWDKHLLTLKSYKNIQIVNPGYFINKYFKIKKNNFIIQVMIWLKRFFK